MCHAGHEAARAGDAGLAPGCRVMSVGSNAVSPPGRDPAARHVHGFYFSHGVNAPSFARVIAASVEPHCPALEGLRHGQGPVTFRREDHRALYDLDSIRIKSSAEPGPGILDDTRPDIAVIEFVRHGGADIIEVPVPGKPSVYRGRP